MQFTTSELYDWFIDTLVHCSGRVLRLSDEELEYALLEEFSVGYVSFLHEDSLAALLRDGYIDGGQASLAKELRVVASAIPQEQWALEAIRTEAVWRELMALSDRILDLRSR